MEPWCQHSTQKLLVRLAHHLIPWLGRNLIIRTQQVLTDTSAVPPRHAQVTFAALYARAKAFPERTEWPSRPGILAPYEMYLRTRWAEGERNAMGLFGELRACGYTGSRMTIERFLLGLRWMEQEGIQVSKTVTSVQLTP